MSNILTSIHGRKVGLGPDGELIVPGGFSAGDGGKQVTFSSPTKVAEFDDFLGDVVADQWNYVEGTDTATADGAIVAAAGGVFRLTGGDSAGTVAADGSELNRELNWKAVNGGLVFEARVALAVITSVNAFIGFSDTKALEAPFTLSGTTLTSNATDAVGFLFDTGATTDNWKLVGVATDVDATVQDIGSAPVAATYETFRIEISAAGAATFYRNGVQVGTTMAGAVTPTVALTPYFVIFPLTAVAGRLLDIDYVHCAMTR